MAKIAHLVCTFPPYRGGMGETCYYQAKFLTELGQEVAVFTPDYGRQKTTLTKPDFPIIYLEPWLKYGNAAWVPQLARYLNQFDIVHLHWPFIGAIQVVLWWKIWHPAKKLIVKYHMELVGQGLFKIIFSVYQWLFLSLTVKLADKIIVSSFDYAEHSRLAKFINHYPKKFVEIPLGVESDEFYPREKKYQILAKYNLSLFDKIILFVGGLDKAHYFKGVDKLIQAFAKFKYKNQSLKLLIVGQGNLIKYYQQLARDLGVLSQVIFADSVSNDELPDYFNLADIFVLPSINQSESFGLVILKAMASAKPVVVSNLPGPRSLVKDNFNGWRVRPGDVEDLAKKIELLINDQSLINAFGQNGQLMVQEKYSWLKVVEQLNQLYQNI